jgi:hypothetical protein
MKIHQIISEDQTVDEAPSGGISRLGQKVMSKLGSKSAQAKLDVGDDANQMKKDLAVWMSGSGLKKGQLSVADFKNFLGQKGLPSDQVDNLFSQMRQNPDGTSRVGGMSNKEIDSILHKAVQQGFKSRGASGTKSRYAQRTPSPTPSGSGAGGGSGLPRSVTNAVNNLSPAQKAALKSML